MRPRTIVGSPVLGVGVYSVSEAHRITGVPRYSIRRWLRGYRFTYRGEVREYEPFWPRQYARFDEEFALGFRDLLEVRAVGAFIRAGVRPQHIRLIEANGRELLGSSHPLTDPRVKTDGRTIFLEISQLTQDPFLVDLFSRQASFDRVVRPYLKGVEFDASGPRRWRPSRGVVLDPDRRFGQPIVEGDGIPTSTLARAFGAEKSYRRVAWWYNTAVQSVKDAVEYERQLAA